jgi:hypothetical protein
MSAASDPSSTWNMLTAIGTLALAGVTVISTGIALWLPRREARGQQKQAKAIEQSKCNVADIQLKSWSEQSGNGRIVHVGWPSWYPVRPVMGSLVSAHGAYPGTLSREENECQVRLVFEPDDPQHDMWFLLFYDPEGNRRILLSAFLRNGHGFSQVYPAPYNQDPTFLAIGKCPEIEKHFDEIARGRRDLPGNEQTPSMPDAVSPV